MSQTVSQTQSVAHRPAPKRRPLAVPQARSPCVQWQAAGLACGGRGAAACSGVVPWRRRCGGVQRRGATVGGRGWCVADTCRDWVLVLELAQVLRCALFVCVSLSSIIFGLENSLESKMKNLSVMKLHVIQWQAMSNITGAWICSVDENGHLNTDEQHKARAAKEPWGGPLTVVMDSFVESCRRSRQNYFNIPEFCTWILHMSMPAKWIENQNVWYS